MGDGDAVWQSRETSSPAEKTSSGPMSRVTVSVLPSVKVPFAVIGAFASPSTFSTTTLPPPEATIKLLSGCTLLWFWEETVTKHTNPEYGDTSCVASRCSPGPRTTVSRGIVKITPSFAALGELSGALGATDSFLSWNILIPVKIATPPSKTVATTTAIVVKFLFIKVFSMLFKTSQPSSGATALQQ